MIPIKGYATFHPLKHCMVGSGFKAEWFNELFTNKKILDPLKRIADETEEDYLKLIDILKSAGVKTYRPNFNLNNKYKSLKQIIRPPVNPRDHFGVIGEKIYTFTSGIPGYADILKQIDRKNLYIRNEPGVVSTASLCRVGKDIWWDRSNNILHSAGNQIPILKKLWENEGFRVHISHRGYHSDSSFCIIKPGCIVSLNDIQNYKKEFPNWDVLYLPDQSWDKVNPFLKMKEKVGGRWWLKGEENNNQLIEFVNTWLNDWVGYVEETVFDVNMLSLDENTIICNNHNKEVFEYFKKHKVEPIIFNFRHRYFWDGGVHCITQDFYREGKMEDYFG